MPTVAEIIASQLAAAEAAAAGVKLIATPIYNVRGFGAKGDAKSDDTAAISAAVAQAYADGVPLYFPAGTYVLTANVPYWNDVVKIGPGKVSVEGNIFAITPGADDTNNLYVDPANGNDGNTGLSPSQAFATLQKAFDVLKARAEVLQGTWKINLAPGFYQEGAELSDVRSAKRLQIIGSVDANGIPTTVFDGGNGLRAFGISVSGAYLKVENVKFQNFTGYNSNGLVAQNGSNLWAKNVHADNIGWAGISCFIQSRVYVTGGKLNNCRIGILVYSASVASIGYEATQLSEGPVITNCTEAGILFQNQSSGHVDCTTIDNCNDGIKIVNQSRAHVLGSAIRNNVRAGVRAYINSTWLNSTSPPNTFSGNGANWVHRAFAAELNSDQNKRAILVPHVDLTSATLTGTTAETDLKAGYTIPANTLVETGRKLRIIATGTFAGPGTKDVRIRFDSGLVIGFTSASGSTKSWQMVVDVYVVNANNQKVFGRWHEGNSAYNAVYAARTLDMTANRVVKLTGQLSDPAGSIVVETFEILEVT